MAKFCFKSIKIAKFWLKRINGDIERIKEVPALWSDQVRELIEGGSNA